MSYQSMKVAELKEELKKLGLPVTGKKDELVQRLLGAKKGGDDAKEDKDGDSDEAEEKEDKGKGKRKLDDVDEDEDAGEKKANKKEKKGDAPSSADILANLTDEGWKTALTPEFSKPYFKEILKTLSSALASGKEIFPPQNEIFSALNYTPLDQVKVVILGQDPYHDNNQANGLCFSVRDGIAHPPSLKNIFKELITDIPGFKVPKSGSLEKWAQRGVLLLNATLTVEAHSANSHSKIGWLTFTDSIIEVLNKKTKGLVFILWGGFAQKKGKIVDRKKHHVIEAAHPSPLSQAFMSVDLFRNALLEQEGLGKIDWSL